MPIAVTLGEQQNRLVQITSSQNPHLTDWLRSHGIVYPHIKLPMVVETLDQGTTAPIRTVDVFRREDSAPISDWDRWFHPTQGHLALYLRKAKEGMSMAKDLGMKLSKRSVMEWFLFSHTKTTKDTKEQGVIVDMAFHPYRQILAMAHAQDLVYLYDLSKEDFVSTSPRGLSVPSMKEVKKVAWNPVVATELAVVTSRGVHFWTVPVSVTPMMQYTSTTFVETSLVNDMNQAVYSPDGRWLVISSEVSDAVIVVDVVTKVVVPVRTGGFSGKGTRQLLFSQDGSFMVQISCSRWMTIYETSTWHSRTLTLKSSILSAVMLKDARTLVYALEGTFGCLCSVKLGMKQGIPDVWTQANVLLDEEHQEMQVQSMELDAVHGSRLSLLVSSPENQRSLLIYKMKVKPVPELSLIGEVLGPVDEEGTRVGVLKMAFMRQCVFGSVLAVGYANGKVTLYPLHYSS